MYIPPATVITMYISRLKFPSKYTSSIIKELNLNTLMVYCRNLTKEQTALIKAYAETDKDAAGTIDGITSTSTGK